MSDIYFEHSPLWVILHDQKQGKGSQVCFWGFISFFGFKLCLTILSDLLQAHWKQPGCLRNIM